MKSFKLFLVVVFTIILFAGSYAQKDNDPISIGKYKILFSKVLKEKRTILIHLPDDYQKKSDKKYPVLYMLYANHTKTYFAKAVSTLNTLGNGGNIPKMILIGITNTNRYRDLLSKTRSGKDTGIEKFIDFLQKELFPWVERNYSTENYRMILGPQAGANFSFYTLFKYSNMFNSAILGNPFRWTGGRDFNIKLAENFLKVNKKFKKNLYFICTENNSLAIKGVEFMKKFEKFVRENKSEGLRFKVNYIQNWDEFLAPIGLRTGLKTIFKNYQFISEGKEFKLNDIKNHYKNCSLEYGYHIKAPEFVLVRSYDNLSRIKTENANEILEYILKYYPKSIDGLARKAGFFVKVGKLDDAIKCLEKILTFTDEKSDNGGMIKRYMESLIKKKNNSKN